MNIEKKRISSEVLFSAIQDLLAENRQAVFTITGMSMWPFLCHSRDQVIVEKCDPKTLKIGDIILFELPGSKYILHRITRMQGEWIQTTGDGNYYRDRFFPASCVRAKVIALIRKEKNIDCEVWTWKLIFRIWMLLFPVRKYLLRLLKGIGKIKRGLSSLRKKPL